MPRSIVKKDGFEGQRFYVVPRPLLKQQTQAPLTRQILSTDAGYFPRARGHRIDRPAGRPELILIYCTDGEGWARVGEQTITVHAGELAILPPGVGHGYGSSEDRPWTIYWTHLAGAVVKQDVLPALRSLAMEGGLLLQVGNDPLVTHRFEEVLNNYDAGIGPGELMTGAGLALALVTQLLVSARRQAGGGASAAVDRVAATIRYIRQKPAMDLSISELAAMARLSPQHYAELFKRLTGFPPRQYCLRQRLARAMQLAVGSGLLFKEIAAEVGFESQLYLSRQFRKVYGLSLSEARRHEAYQDRSAIAADQVSLGKGKP
jgi:AraC family transcriptional regulator, arabinose operon regulatory protein